MKKTKFESYCLNGMTKGCKYCVNGEKLVLFLTGKCSRGCYYCSLSTNRKNKEVIFANERRCFSVKDAIKEAEESNSKGAGITGGDPLMFLERTLSYAKALKRRFSNFHIHIYLPTKLVNLRNLKLLSSCIDEIRFHPSFLCEKGNDIESSMKRDIEKIKSAGLFFDKKDIGCEFPILPDKKEAILKFIIDSSPYLGFVNLNELEISETNLNVLAKQYNLNKDTYTISGSKDAGLWILKECKKSKLKISVHVCTANTKNHYQYRNRLLMHKILPYSKRTGDGSMIYFAICCKNRNDLNKKEKMIRELRDYYIDRKKSRIIISEKISGKVLDKGLKLARIEEFPTFDRMEIEFIRINE